LREAVRSTGRSECNVRIVFPRDECERFSTEVEWIDKEDEAILRELGKKSPRLCLQYALETNTDISRKTVGKRLQSLLAKGLVVYPKGERKGVTITGKGRELLRRLDAQSTR
jgi:predicted transcriptional regulator